MRHLSARRSLAAVVAPIASTGAALSMVPASADALSQPEPPGFHDRVLRRGPYRIHAQEHPGVGLTIADLRASQLAGAVPGMDRRPGLRTRIKSSIVKFVPR